jgi:hypothetical protein
MGFALSSLPFIVLAITLFSLVQSIWADVWTRYTESNCKEVSPSLLTLLPLRRRLLLVLRRRAADLDVLRASSTKDLLLEVILREFSPLYPRFLCLTHMTLKGFLRTLLAFACSAA